MNEDRLPPHSLEAEQAVLSLILAAPESLDTMGQVEPILKAEDFYDPNHREIYRSALAVHRKKQLPDIVVIGNDLKQRGKIDSVGGMARLMEIIDYAPNTANVRAYAKTIRDKANVRRLLDACQDISARAYVAHGDDSAFIHESGLRLRDVTRVADKAAVRSNVDALKAVFTRIEKNVKLGDLVTGLRTGIDAYDRKTTGLHGKQLTVLGARPGSGKSSRLLQMANAAASAGIGVYFFSLEMTQEENLQRLIAMRAKVNASKLELGQIPSWDAVTIETDIISKLPLIIDESPDLTIDNIRERSLGAIEDGLNKGQPIGLIVVDYLQRIRVRPEDRKKPRVEVVADMARGLKELAKETSLPVVSAAALKRIPEGRSGRRPTMDDLRECGDIENEADTICLIHRPAMYDNKASENEAELIIDKARHGTPGVVSVRWQPEFVTFTDNPEDPSTW